MTSSILTIIEITYHCGQKSIGTPEVCAKAGIYLRLLGNMNLIRYSVFRTLYAQLKTKRTTELRKSRLRAELLTSATDRSIFLNRYS